MRHHAPLILALLLALAGLAEARFEWRDVEQTVTLRADGSVEIDDVRTLWTPDEDFGEAFVCLGHGPEVELNLLEGSGAVSSGPDAEAYTQACESGDAGTEMVVEQDERVQERRVRFHYVLDGTIDAYGDVVQWYWNLVQLDHPPIEGYTLSVRAPGAMEAPYDAFVHRYDNPEEPTVRLSDDRRTLEVSFDSVPSGDGVEIRWLMPPALFDLQGEGQRLETFLQEEAELARLDVEGSPRVSVSDGTTATGASGELQVRARDPDGIERIVARVGQGERVACEGTDPSTCPLRGLAQGGNQVTVLAYDTEGNIGSATVTVTRLTLLDRIRRQPLAALPPVALVLWAAWGIGRAYWRHGREPDVPAMKYPFEPPADDLAPAAVASMQYQRKPSESKMTDALFATIMDLARRGYGRFTGEGRDFEMELDLDKDDSELLPFEREVLDFLKEAAARRGDDEPARLELKELKAHAKRNKTFLKKWNRAVRSHLEERRGGELTEATSKKIANRWAVRAFAVAFVSFLFFFFLDGLAAGISIGATAAAMLLLVVASASIPAWRRDIAQEVQGWKGFKRTLTDYTTMKDAPHDFYGLWDVYYCYAAALGVAERFLKTLERAAPDAGIDDHDLRRRAHWMGPSAVAASDFGALSQSVNSLSSALSAASASASSGGSSSGGGGGGGGGGGSGGR